MLLEFMFMLGLLTICLLEIVLALLFAYSILTKQSNTSKSAQLLALVYSIVLTIAFFTLWLPCLALLGSIAKEGINALAKAHFLGMSRLVWFVILAFLTSLIRRRLLLLARSEIFPSGMERQIISILHKNKRVTVGYIVYQLKDQNYSWQAIYSMMQQMIKQGDINCVGDSSVEKEKRLYELTE